MVIWNALIENGSTENLQLFIGKMMHDIASPLNTIIMGVESFDNSDPMMRQYVNESAAKMASMLQVFRKILQTNAEKISCREIEQSIENICETSITSHNLYLNLDIAQLLMCSLYAVISSTSKISNITCRVGESNFVIRVYASNLFCSFDRTEPASARNIFQYTATKFAYQLGLTIAVQQGTGYFDIVCS